ncbi:MAG: hypothetical protein Q7K54_06190 [Candidatus Parcubacteria bacterium]|nr:hypothetical protein [Candidatus Parcubacteria bacterium]
MNVPKFGLIFVTEYAILYVDSTIYDPFSKGHSGEKEMKILEKFSGVLLFILGICAVTFTGCGKEEDAMPDPPASIICEGRVGGTNTCSHSSEDRWKCRLTISPDGYFIINIVPDENYDFKEFCEKYDDVEYDLSIDSRAPLKEPTIIASNPDTWKERLVVYIPQEIKAYDGMPHTFSLTLRRGNN